MGRGARFRAALRDTGWLIQVNVIIGSMPHEKYREVSPADLDKVMSTIDIPACPAAVTDAMKEAQRDEPDIRRLSNIIATDPGMSATALKLANSPLYGTSSPVAGVRQAADRLGIRNIVCVVVASALRNSITGLPAAWLDKFWKRVGQLSIATAIVARQQYGISPDAAYTYALFHNAGIPLMAKRFTNYISEVLDIPGDGPLLIEAEDYLFPSTHPIIGMLLVRSWGLQPLLGKAICFHHDPEAYDLPDTMLPGGALSLIAAAHVAERLTAEVLGEADREVGPLLYERGVDHLGLSDDDLFDLRQRIAQIVGNDA